MAVHYYPVVDLSTNFVVNVIVFEDGVTDPTTPQREGQQLMQIDGVEMGWYWTGETFVGPDDPAHPNYEEPEP